MPAFRKNSPGSRKAKKPSNNMSLSQQPGLKNNSWHVSTQEVKFRIASPLSKKMSTRSSGITMSPTSSSCLTVARVVAAGKLCVTPCTVSCSISHSLLEQHSVADAASCGGSASSPRDLGLWTRGSCNSNQQFQPAIAHLLCTWKYLLGAVSADFSVCKRNPTTKL